MATCYLLYGYLGALSVVFLPVGLVVLVALIYGFSELDARRKGVEPIPSSSPRDANVPE